MQILKGANWHIPQSMVIPSVVNPALFVEERPWGRFERFSLNEPVTVKLVYVDPDRRLSLQYHNNRDEFWKVIKGPVQVRTENEIAVLHEGDSIMIPRKTIHRLGGLEEQGIILELSYGQFDESDIVRLEDDFERKPETAKSSPKKGPPMKVAPKPSAKKK